MPSELRTMSRVRSALAVMPFTQLMRRLLTAFSIVKIQKKTKLIEMEDLAALEQSFQRIKQMEKAMRMQFDDEGQPLFSDEDIRNELYTPLVRSGLIPDNMVPDKFKFHARLPKTSTDKIDFQKLKEEA